MSAFPRTEVGGLSVSRMIVGTNWFSGYSHCTPAKDMLIKELVGNRKAIADILEVFFSAGVNAVMGMASELLVEAIKDAEDRTGVSGIIVSTPSLPFNRETAERGFDLAQVASVLDNEVKLGTAVCMPHTSVTDVMVDKCARKVRQMDAVCPMIRERGMIPGLSTHIPETIIYSDETGLDVETYISIYNAMGFLMQVEVDWISSVIRNAKKPVMTIKPMAAGQIRPFQAFNFVWNTIRDCDMVTVGTMTPDEAKELIEMSLAILERRDAQVKLQETRSKASIKGS